MRCQRFNRGQATVEMAVATLALIAALVTMLVYVQRAMQGHTFEGAQSVGQPFDLNDGFSESSTISTHDETVMYPSHAMIEAEMLPVGPTLLAAFTLDDTPDWRQTMFLKDLPVGPVPREPANWRWTDGVQMKSSWDTDSASSAGVLY